MQLEPLSLPTLLPFAVLFLSTISLWSPYRFLGISLLGAAVGTGYVTGILTGPALAPIVALALACWWYQKQDARTDRWSAMKSLTAVVVIVIALLLTLHVAPGFHNPVLVRQIVLSPESAPYTKYINFDKTAAGILILGFCYQGFIRNRRELTDAFGRAWLIIVITIAAVVGLSLASGYVRFDPKWTNFFWPWSIMMIFTTCMAEEALFRGFIQRQLQLHFGTYRFGNLAALSIGAVLFGLLHYKGGIGYVLLATIAGIGYGLVFRRTGRIEMSILTHFLLNATHFLLFTYPNVAKG